MISVCMATHNGAKYIKQQIDSILIQLSEEDELVISDDGSTDGTIEIIQSYNCKNIKLFILPPPPKKLNNSSEYVGRNFENAIKKAKGSIIFLSDQDDIWVEGRLNKMLEALGDKALVVSDAWRMTEENPHEGMQKLYLWEKPIHNFYLRRGKPYGCTLAFKSDMKKYILPFPYELPLYDYWIALISELMGGATYLDEPLLYHRYHQSNTSGTTSFTIWYKIWYRTRLLFQIYKRTLKHKLIETLK